MSRARRALRTVATLVAVAAPAAALASWLVFVPPTRAVPSFDEVRAGHRPSDLLLLDRHGEVLDARRVDLDRRRLEWTPLDRVAPALRRAVVVSEDRRFAEHGGVDLRALAAGALARLRGGPRRGGSTIAMQLADLLDLSPSRAGGRGLAGKLSQVAAARAIAASWSREQILEAYLDLAPLRGEAVGVDAASRLLFGKAPHALSDAESVTLAALLRAPNASPRAVRRRAEILAADLAREGDPAGTALSGPAGSAAVAAAVERACAPGAARSPVTRASLAPHAAARLLRPGGPPAQRTTLDAGLQRATSEILERQVRAISQRNVRDGAAVVLDVESGEILAWVGGSGAASSARHVDGVTAHRQAGSTLKPMLYATALDERRLTAASPIADLPLEVAVTGTGVWRPRDYDPRWRGLVTMREALAGSLNVPAVRTLQLVGPSTFATALRRMGFSGVDRPGDHYGPALALGAAEVSLLELANAYRALARGGLWTPTAPLSTEPGGRTGTRATGAGERIWSAEAAFVVADVLSDRDGRSATFGLENALATRFWSAVKTGTSRDMRDNWCVGFTRRHVVAVWVGNFSGEPMHDVSGVSGAAPAWQEIVGLLQAGLVDERPAPPPGLVRRRVRFGSEPERDEWFLAGTEPGSHLVETARPIARIESPVDDGVFAIDPDAPSDRQRIVLDSSGAPPGASWRMDGEGLGEAERLLLWEPRPGRHRLELADPGGRVLDRVAFEVRGPGPAAPPSIPPSSRRPPRSPGR
ncbi:penicillin-binding protein 1C [bacterium]|nr:penicillin-binding protein 1C [bacterium]